MSDMNNPADDNNGAMDDLWAEALSEQKSTSSKSAADAVFQQFGGGDVSGTLQDIDLIMDIPVKLTVELGRTRMTIKELLRLTQGSVVALDGLAGEPLDIPDQRLFNRPRAKWWSLPINMACGSPISLLRLSECAA